jgi:hypothetical protein
METPIRPIESLFESVEAYGKTTIALSKLKAIEAATAVITSLVSRMIVFIVITLFVVFLSIGMALYLGNMLEKPYYGFFIVAAFYLVAGTIFSFSLQKWMKEPVSNLLMTQLYQNTDGTSRNNREGVRNIE